jgi:ubiquinone/menaquinone biosynthesis C-methylase UbiE
MYIDEIGRYWDSRADGYSITIHEEFDAGVGEKFGRILQESAPEGTGLKCLDVGCGPGFFSILLARRGHDVTAVDYSEGMLEKARKNFAEANVSVHATTGDAHDLPFADESFDYIVSRNLVWNLEFPERAYAGWISLLRPGGRLLVADGNHYLYYYDDDYLRAKEFEDANDAHNCHGVDPTPINEIAKNLPLSRERRPSWDMDKLLSMGMSDVGARVIHRRFTSPDTGEEKLLIGDFVLCAGKPL